MAPVEMEELSAEIQVALPSIAEKHLMLLIQHLAEKGVHSKDDMPQLDAADLREVLPPGDAKKLLVHFNAKCEEEGPCLADGRNTELETKQAKEEEVCEEAPWNICDELLSIGEMPQATIRDIERLQEQASQAHVKLLRSLREGDRLRAERHKKLLQETIEEETRAREIRRQNQEAAIELVKFAALGLKTLLKL